MIAENIKTIANIRDNCYDLCIGLREDLSNIPIQLMCGAKKNISFSTNTSFEVFLDESVENDEKKHSAEINFDLLKLRGVEKPAKVLPELFIKEQDEEWSRQFLNKSGSKDNNIKVGFSIGGGWYLNWWPISNFAKLGKRCV